MVADHAQYSRPAGGHVRAFRYVPLVLCTAVASSLLTWSVAMRTASAADMVRLGGALLSGAANCTNTSSSVAATAAAGGSAREEDHRKAVIDRLYGGDDAADHLGSMRLLDPERMPPFTMEAQHWIWERQNPPPSRCREQKFLLGYVEKPGLGMGALLHVGAAFLGHAHQYDRIFRWHDEGANHGQVFADQNCSRGEPYQSLDCLFEPLSTCDGSSVTEENSFAIPAFDMQELNASHSPLPWTYRRGPEYWEERLREHFIARGVNVTDTYLKYWWRAQAVAYIVRPNAPTMEAIRALRMDTSLQQVYYQTKLQEAEHMPYPLPRGTVSMHVRHGDKAREMQLVEFRDYVAAAETLVSHNPLNLKRVAFVSSEDPDVIKEAARMRRIDTGVMWTPDIGWVMYLSELQRMNTGPSEQLAKFGRTGLSVQWLYQLFLALECDVWIGTRNSNWNRLIDEMRCTVVDKCDGTYIEVGIRRDWKDYHWR